jgi:zinc-ribbon domain
MTAPRKFCTECGAPLAIGMRFCSQCGHAVATPAGPPAQPVAAVPGGGEQILHIVPFLEQGLLSVVHYTLIVTDQRLIFCPWDMDTDEAMSEADDSVMQESCSISETMDEIAHFRAKDWSAGPWQRYLSMAPDAITAGAPGTIVVPLEEIEEVNIVCETRTSTQDRLSIRHAKQELEFDLMYSQGPFLSRVLSPLLVGRFSIEDHLHRRRGLDRLLSGQEYR